MSKAVRALGVLVVLGVLSAGRGARRHHLQLQLKDRNTDMANTEVSIYLSYGKRSRRRMGPEKSDVHDRRREGFLAWRLEVQRLARYFR